MSERIRACVALRVSTRLVLDELKSILNYGCLAKKWLARRMCFIIRPS